MSGRRGDPSTRPLGEEYWSWVAVALFLLVTVDVLTTVFAAAVVGPAAAANPLMRWALERGPAAVVGMNLAAVLVAVLLFYGLLEVVRRTPDPFDRCFALLVEVWLGLLLAVGLALLANDLSVIVLGRTLL